MRRSAGAGGIVDLSTSPRSEGVNAIVELRGELDISAVPRLREELADLIPEGHHHHHPVVDLHGVDFLIRQARMASMADSHAPPARRVPAAGVHPGAILKIFRITGLINVFSMHTTSQDSTAPNSDG
jgi:hypothetical protein